MLMKMANVFSLPLKSAVIPFYLKTEVRWYGAIFCTPFHLLRCPEEEDSERVYACLRAEYEHNM